MTEIFAGVTARGGVPATVSAGAWLAALLEAEAALAQACADAGLIPGGAAEAVMAACSDPTRYDVAALGLAAADAGNPVVPLVRAIEVLAGPEHGRYVHHGATSQDILDTAMMLVAGRAVGVIVGELNAAAGLAAGLAARHRDAVMAGRTLLQQALPTTFGLVAAGWLLALRGAADRADAVRLELPAQLGGAVGTMSGWGAQADAVRESYARRLGLPLGALAWHTDRLPVADLAGSLAAACGVLAKIALDVVLLAQTEVAEVSEGGARGGSSAMPHKHNPIAAVSVLASARRAPNLAATLFACLAQEHQRAAGAWHTEWETLTDLLRCTGSAAAWLTECLAGLQVDPARMLANLSGGAVDSQRLAEFLTPTLGRAGAHDRVASALRRAGTTGESIGEVLLADADIREVLSAERVDELIRPDTGRAGALVDRALASARERTGAT